ESPVNSRRCRPARRPRHRSRQDPDGHARDGVWGRRLRYGVLVHRDRGHTPRADNVGKNRNNRTPCRTPIKTDNVGLSIIMEKAAPMARNGEQSLEKGAGIAPLDHRKWCWASIKAGRRDNAAAPPSRAPCGGDLPNIVDVVMAKASNERNGT